MSARREGTARRTAAAAGIHPGSALPAVSILVPTSGRAPQLERCLRAVFRSIAASGAACEVLTIHAPGDDASTAMVRARFDEVRVLEADERNLARQRNLGAAAARGDVVVYLDDDAWPQEGWLRALLEPFDDPSVSAVGGRVESEDGSPQVESMAVDAYGRQVALRAPDARPRGSALTVAGGNFAVRRRELRRIGGYDENYRYHYEDTDFCWRLQRQGGAVRYAPRAAVFHERAAGPHRRSAFDRDWRTITANATYFAFRHARGGALRRALVPLLLQLPKTLRAFLRCARGRVSAGGLGRFLAGQARGLVDGYRRRHDAPRLPFAGGPGRPPDARSADERRAAVARTVAVIVNYRCADQTVACVESLRRTAPGVGVIVVDNDSRDDSVEVLRHGLREAARGAELIASGENRGFGGGCNLGIERALSRPDVDHVLLLNPDAEVEPRALQELLGTAWRHPEAGVVGGRVVGMNGATVQYEAGRFPWWSLSGLHARARGTEFETEFVTGALMLLDAGLLREGLRFDETYFLYVEDLDLGREVLRRGRTLRVNTRARIRHREGGTQPHEALVAGLRPLQLRHMTRGKVYFARKRLPWPKRLVALLVVALLKPLFGALRYRTTAFLPLYFRAVKEGFALPVRRRP